MQTLDGGQQRKEQRCQSVYPSVFACSSTIYKRPGTAVYNTQSLQTSLPACHDLKMKYTAPQIRHRTCSSGSHPIHTRMYVCMYDVPGMYVFMYVCMYVCRKYRYPYTFVGGTPAAPPLPASLGILRTPSASPPRSHCERCTPPSEAPITTQQCVRYFSQLRYN